MFVLINIFRWKLSKGITKISNYRNMGTIKERIVTTLKKNLLTLIGAGVGAVAGFLYWYFIGCNSGGCAITSSPVNSSLYGILMGALVFSMFKKEDKKSN